MKALLVVFISLFMFSCNSTPGQVKDFTKETYAYDDVIDKDSFLYLKNENRLFSGLIVEKDSIGRIVNEVAYENGRKHRKEIHYEYFESDLAVVVLEGKAAPGNLTMEKGRLQ